MMTITARCRPRPAAKCTVALRPRFRHIALLALCAHVVCLTGVRSAIADDYISPMEIEGASTIDAETLIELATEQDNLVIIDARIRTDRRQGYIAGSISLPDTETNCVSLLDSIGYKETPVVFYCNGIRCRRSDRAVVIARDCGYRNIYWFRGGFEEWKNKNYLISR